MRRIPRIRQPSGLVVAPSSRSLSTQFPATCKAASPLRSTTQQHVQRAAPIAGLARFYSTDKDPKQNNSTPASLGGDYQQQQQSTDLATTEGGQELAEHGDYGIEAEWQQQNEGHQYGRFKAPPSLTHAEHADQVSDANYVPAQTMAGLETVGGLRGYWGKEENWSTRSPFVGFRPASRTLDVPVLEAATRRALVEALALRQAGGDAEEKLMMAEWPLVEDATWARVEVSAGADGGPVLKGDVKAVAQSLLNGAEFGGEPVAQRAMPVEEATQHTERWGEEWKAVSLDDLKLKFVINKRVFQLTGQRVPDHKLDEPAPSSSPTSSSTTTTTTTTVDTLLHHLRKQPKPRTLAQELAEQQRPELAARLSALPNLKMHGKRQTRGDKDRALGRFKLIEEEFRRRQLPVKGHGWVRKGNEIANMRGLT